MTEYLTPDVKSPSCNDFVTGKPYKLYSKICSRVNICQEYRNLLLKHLNQNRLKQTYFNSIALTSKSNWFMLISFDKVRISFSSLLSWEELSVSPPYLFSSTMNYALEAIICKWSHTYEYTSHFAVITPHCHMALSMLHQCYIQVNYYLTLHKHLVSIWSQSGFKYWLNECKCTFSIWTFSVTYELIFSYFSL